MGQLPPGRDDPGAGRRGGAGGRSPADPDRLAFITQTTLSVDDTAEIVAILRERFPEIDGPTREDICYATTNRQAAVKAVAPECDLVVVIGSPNSSQLAAAARGGRARRRAPGDPAAARRRARLVGAGRRRARLGLTAGASAPGIAGEELLGRLGERYALTSRSAG